MGSTHQAPSHCGLAAVVVVEALQRNGVYTIWGEVLGMVILWRVGWACAWSTDKRRKRGR